MTSQFILDENVVILAQKGEDARGHLDPVCADLVASIIEICHTIVVDDVLWGKYLSQLDILANQLPGIGPHLIRLLKGATQMPGKIEGFGRTASSFEGEGDIPPGSVKDTYLVRLAVESGAILVTADGPLSEGLESSGIQFTYGLQVTSPEEALTIL